MARFTVHMTFNVPTSQGPFVHITRIPGRALRMFAAGNGCRMAVSATVRADSPSVAAIVAAARAEEVWRREGTGGALIMVSWTAHRQRVLVGARRPVSSSRSTGRPWDDWPDGDDGDGGLAGVREPRRPSPPPGTMSAARPIPGSPQDTDRHLCPHLGGVEAVRTERSADRRPKRVEYRSVRRGC